MWTKAATSKNGAQPFREAEMFFDSDSLPTLLPGNRDSAERKAIADVLQAFDDVPSPPDSQVQKGTTLQRSKKAFSAAAGKNAKTDSCAPQHKESTISVAEEKSSAWTSVGRMVGHLGIFRKGTPKAASSLNQEARVTDAELLELAKLESLVLADYETVKYAFQVVTADKACFTESDLRYAVSQNHSKAKLLSSTPGADDKISLVDVPRIFASLCKLLKYEQGPIPKAIFLMFPERLRFERLQRARCARTGVLRAGEAPLEGARLLQLLAKGAKTPEAAKKLLNQVGAAIQLRPQATADVLLKSNKAYGPNAGIRFVVNLIRQHGAACSGIGLDILISGWSICGALAESAVALDITGNSRHGRKGNALMKAAGALGAFGNSSMQRLRRLRNGAHHAKDSEHGPAPDKLGIATKVVLFGTRLARKLPNKKKRRQYQRKVATSSESDEAENHAHLWQILPPGEILHCVRQGATSLDGDDFKQLLQAAWALFDDCDAVSWMIEPKACSDSRAVDLLAVQEELANIVTVDFHRSEHAEDAEPMHQQLLRSHHAIKELRQLCEEASDGILRRAALYGLPILLERVSRWIHASVDRITNPSIASPSRVVAHNMDSVVAKVLESLTPYEVAVEDGLGYQAPHHSCDTYLSSVDSSTAGAAVVNEEAWRRYLRSRENAQRAQMDAKNAESRDDARFCNHKLLGPRF